MSTHILNRPHFFQSVRNSLYHGKLTQDQVTGMDGILSAWEKLYSNYDDRYLAYMLATTFHETDTKMKPIEEYGKGKGKPYGVPDPKTGKIYYGRGFVQLTWKYNYEKFATMLNADLVKKPELALDLNIATQILLIGMIKGSFTGKKLSDYLNADKTDWVNARRIINGTDKAQLIAGYALHFYNAIAYMTVSPEDKAIAKLAVNPLGKTGLTVPAHG